MLRTIFSCKNRKGNNSVITFDGVTVLVFCAYSDGLVSMYERSFNSLLYFRDMLWTSFLLHKNKKGSKSINTG